MSFQCPTCHKVVAERFSQHTCVKPGSVSLRDLDGTPVPPPPAANPPSEVTPDMFERLPDGAVEILLPDGRCAVAEATSWCKIMAKVSKRTTEQASQFHQVVLMPDGKQAVSMEYRGEKPFKGR